MACPCPSGSLPAATAGSRCRAVLEAGWVSGAQTRRKPPILSSLLCPTADKYCPLLIKEGGMPLLRELIKMATARQETKEMAR